MRPFSLGYLHLPLPGNDASDAPSGQLSKVICRAVQRRACGSLGISVTLVRFRDILGGLRPLITTW